MATKSRKFSRSVGLKTVAFLLICLCICQVVYTGLQIIHQIGKPNINVTGDVLFVSDYTQSESFVYNDFYSVARELQDIINTRSISQSQREFLNSRVTYYINDGNGFEYYNTVYRDPEQFTDYAAVSYIYEQGWYTSYYGPTENSLWHYNTYDGGDPRDPGEFQVYFAFYPQYLSERQAVWSEVRLHLTPDIYIMAGCFVLAVLLTVYLSFVTGRRPHSDELHLSTFDRMYSDLILMTQACFIGAWIGLVAVYNEQYMNTHQSYLPAIWFGVIVTAIITPCVLALYLSLVRKIKARRLLRHSLIGAIILGIIRLIRSIFRGISRLIDMLLVGSRFRDYPFARAMFRRQANYLLASATVVFFFALFAFNYAYLWMTAMIGVEIVLTAHYVRANNNTFEDMERICSQVYEVYQGNMDFNPQVREGTQLFATSRQLLDIGEGMNRSITRQLAAERTKIALVTNVSHDLKTPLTSIIGYIDLLSKDETLSPEARDYVTILTNKSQRLKTIIEDLFDLAKTTSGDDNLNPEILDLRRLIEQTMAEMEDKITQSGQVVKATLPEDAVHIYADGRKLYRVIQNVMDNALKYSMAGTRIFITLSHNESYGRIDFKNTASYEMNFTAEEILERFARGDEARTTEGSGLGLSIAEGFTRACGGDMKVSIDGDQFKLSLIFPLSALPGELPEEVMEEAPPFLLHAEERGKVYKPAETPPTPVYPVEDGHFEPEKPVEISELESVLEAFDDERFAAEADQPSHLDEAKEQIMQAGRSARQKLGEFGVETGEALEYLKEMFHVPGKGKQADHAKESRWKRPKAFEKKSAREQAKIQEAELEHIPVETPPEFEEGAFPDETPEFIRHFQELKAETQEQPPKAE